jgi:DNA-binding IscR family transcriptional regulator
MFRLSKITDYGILLLAHMASRNATASDSEIGDLATARELAEQVDLPLPIVSKILKSLAREGMIESHRGAKGGYRLRAEAVGLCLHESSCSVRQPWQMINKVVQDALGDITLADLARPEAAKPNPLDRFMSAAESTVELTNTRARRADHE